jgi:transposase
LPTLYIGIDIAARSASIATIRHIQDKPRCFDIEQSETGFQQLHQTLQQSTSCPSQAVVVMEATANYWVKLANDLTCRGYRLSVVNPASAYYFARSVLKRDKTDAMDATTLAEMAAVMYERLPLYKEPPPIYEALRQRLLQRDALVHVKVQTGNRKHAHTARGSQADTTQQRTQAFLKLLNEQIRAIEQELDDLCQSDDEWAASARRLQTVKGVGTVAAAWILVATQNFQTFDTPQQVASYVGLVPRQRQSGTSLKGRGSIGFAGHRKLRHVLYMATLSAIQHNPHIKDFFKRLVAKGKPGKVAIIAAERKLLHICYGVVKNQQDYDPEYSKS